MRRAAIVVGALAAASPAFAQRSVADRAAAEGQARADAKDYLGALVKFREAYAADPRPDVVCNLGVAYNKAQDLPRAHVYLTRCVVRPLNDARYMDGVRATLAAIEAALHTGEFTPVDVVVDPPSATVALDTFAPGETFDGGRTVWLPFGKHRVTVRAEGYLEQTVDADARDHAVVSLKVKLERARVVTPPPHPPSQSRPSMVPAIATSAATVVLAGVAIYAAGTARDHAELAGFALSDDGYQTEHDAVTRWNRIFGVTAGLAAAGAIASGYLWYRVLRHPVQLEAAPGRVAVALGGRF